MIQFIKPTNLNGAELLQELNAAGIAIIEPPTLDGNGVLWLDIADKDESKAVSVVAAHNGTIIPREPTVIDKLTNAGLSVNELKAALGL